MPNCTMDRLEGAVAGQLQCLVRRRDLLSDRKFLLKHYLAVGGEIANDGADHVLPDLIVSLDPKR